MDTDTSELKKIRIAIADDHCLFRQSIARALKTEPSFDVVQEAADGKILVDLLRKDQADVILLDLEMPVLSGWQVLEVLNKEFPKSRVIIVSMHFEGVIIRELMARGARGFLPKNTEFDLLIKAIYEVHDHGYYISREFSEDLIKDIIVNGPSRFAVKSLNEREIEILLLICKDKITSEIAKELNVSERTVERHRSSIYEKTKAKTPAGLVLYALRNNLLSNVA